MRDFLELIGIIVVSIVLFLFLADTKITFSPFSFKCLHLLKATGWITVAIGIALIVADTSKTKYEQGLKDGAAYTIEEIDKTFQEAIREKDSSIKDVKVDISIQNDFDDEKQEPSN